MMDDFGNADPGLLSRVKRELADSFDEEQEFRFMMRIHDPLKQWKLSSMDVEKAEVILPERVHHPDYVRHPAPPEMHVPAVY